MLRLRREVKEASECVLKKKRGGGRRASGSVSTKRVDYAPERRWRDL